MPIPYGLRVAAPAAHSERASLAGAAGLGLVGVGLELARPWPLALAIDYALAGRSWHGLDSTALLVVSGIAIVVLTAAAGLTDMGSVVLAERAAERVGAHLRQTVFDRALALSLRWHDRMRSGELVSRLTTDVGRILDAIVAITITLVPAGVRVVVVLLLLSLFSPSLALVALAVIPVLAIFAVRQRRLVRVAQQDARTETGRLAGVATDVVRNVRAVQAFARAGRSSAEFGLRNRAVLGSNLRAVTTEARWTPVADIVLAFGTGLVVVIGGREVLAGQLSVGDLVVVTTYLAALYAPVRSLSRLAGVLAKSSASAARLGEVLACTEEIADRPDAIEAPHAVREVRFRNVSFSYRGGRPVLRDFELTIPAGQTVCLVGASGAGKSTLLHLLLRLYDTNAGRVEINGIDVRELRLDSLRQRIAFVPQDPWLFDASVAENIAYGAAGATLDDIEAAGRIALVDEFVDRLADGYSTVVGEAGAQLSGGQRRRIALARAVVSDAPLVLLDEPTASLDPQSATQVIDAVRRSTTGRTVLIVTHDPALVEFADRVVRLERIVTGVHSAEWFALNAKEVSSR